VTRVARKRKPESATGKREKISLPGPAWLVEPMRQAAEFSRQVQKDRARAAAEHAEREAQAKAALAQPPSNITRALAAETWGRQPIKKDRKRRRPRGAPREYDRDAIRAVAEDYIKNNGCPRSNRLLCEKLPDLCKTRHIFVPEERWLQHIVSPVFKRLLMH
jgi:hypothetical protein